MPPAPEGHWPGTPIGGSVTHERSRFARLPLITPRRFFTTPAGPCPYLPGRIEQRVVTPLQGDDPAELSLLGRLGFRRSQRWVYRPACPGCRACVPVRVVVAEFVAGRRFRRVQARNADLTAVTLPPVATDEQFALFARYQAGRHAEGGMAEMNRADYAQMLEEAGPATTLTEFRDAEGTLVAAAITDVMDDGLSGVYKFFAPELARRSLGTFAVLWHIETARRLALPFVYLGYWVSGSATMDYKAQFAPIERLDGSRWVPLATIAEPAASDAAA